MKGSISMGTLLFGTFAIAVTALVLGVVAVVGVGNIKPIVNYIVAPSASPTVVASPSASVMPTKKVTLPLRQASPVVSVSPTVK